MTTIVNENTDAGPIRRSPLQSVHEQLGARFVERAGWQLPRAYTPVEQEVAAARERVGLADLSALGMMRLRGAPAPAVLRTVFGAAPERVGAVAYVEEGEHVGATTLARLTDDEFLLITEPVVRSALERLEATLQEVAAGGFLTAVDQTSGYAGLLIVGPESPAVVSKLCALSFIDGVAQTSFASVHATIIRNERDELPAFEVYVERPYGVYLWETIMDAGREFNIAPLGWETLETLGRCIAVFFPIGRHVG